MKTISFAMAAVLLVAAFPMTAMADAKTKAKASVHKCEVDGKTVFQDQPCQNEMEVAPQAKPAAVDGPTSGSDAFFNEADKPPYRPAQTADLATATPRDFFMRSLHACENKNEGEYFSQFTYRLRYAFSRKSPSQRSQMFELYCQGTTAASVADMLTKRSFAIMASTATEEGVHKSTLCWRPKEAPDSQCKDMLDVAVENGQLKRDEF